MITFLRGLRLFANGCLFVLCAWTAIQYKTSIYLLRQAAGQLALLSGTQSFSEYEATYTLNAKQKENLQLIAELKRYSVDSLDYKPTENFTHIYDQKGEPVLWVVTGCEPYALRPYEWTFPFVGRVSYKGFFKKELAVAEYNHLVVQGYDADLRPVSAWSTLGWLHDPVLSSMLERSKGSLCNLIFHELFHATYYASSSVDLNENLASFVAHKATIRFLQHDSTALRTYLSDYSDNTCFEDYMLRRMKHLKNYYTHISKDPGKYLLKLKAIAQIVDSLQQLPLKHPERYLSRRKEILKFKNAYLVDFLQYNSLQDSLEKVFNKIYRGKIEKMVRDLRLHGIYY